MRVSWSSAMSISPDFGEGVAALAELDPKRRLARRDPGGVDRLLSPPPRTRRAAPPRPRRRSRSPAASPRRNGRAGRARPRASRSPRRRRPPPRPGCAPARHNSRGRGAAPPSRSASSRARRSIWAALAGSLPFRPSVDSESNGRPKRRLGVAVETLDAEAVAALGGGIGDSGVRGVGDRHVRALLHVGPVDPEIGQRIERGGRVERRRVERIRGRRLLGEQRSGTGAKQKGGQRGRHPPPRIDLKHGAKLAVGGGRRQP